MAGGGSRASAFRGVILLDTNVVSAVMLQRPEPAVVAWLDQVDLRDTLIAGIALAHQAQLATRNLRHFSDTGLSLIHPFPETPSQ